MDLIEVLILIIGLGDSKIHKKVQKVCSYYNFFCPLLPF